MKKYFISFSQDISGIGMFSGSYTKIRNIVLENCKEIKSRRDIVEIEKRIEKLPWVSGEVQIISFQELKD